MSRIKKTSVNSLRPNPPATKLTKRTGVSNSTPRPYPGSSVSNSYGGLDPLDFMSVHNLEYSTNDPHQDYSSSNYDSFGGGSSDGNGASSDW